MDIKKIFQRTHVFKYAARSELLAFLALISAALTPLSAAAEFDSVNWEWRSEVSATSSEGLTVFEIPEGAYSQANPDLSDLRVVAGGREAPYAVLPETEPWKDAAVATELLSVSSRGGTTTAVFKVKEAGATHNTLVLAASGTNFKRNVEVYASGDGLFWEALNERAVIFSERLTKKNAVMVSDLALPYPPTAEPFIKIIISDHGTGSIGISGGTVLRRTVLGAFRVAYDVAFIATVDEKTGSRDLIADLGSYSFPHRRAVLSTTNENFGRAVAVYESDNRKDWRRIGSAYVFSESGEKFTGKNLQILYPATNARYLKLSLIERDAPSIRITGVTLFGEARKVAVPYESELKHYLYFGNSVAARPNYGEADTRLLTVTGSSEPLELAALPAVKNPVFVPLRNPSLPVIFGWAIGEGPLFVAVLLLAAGFFCYRLFGRR